MQLSIFCLNSSDKFILADFSGDNAVVGIYGIACAFATVVIIFSGSYLGYLFPDIYKTLSAEKKDYAKIIKKFYSVPGYNNNCSLTVDHCYPLCI